MHVIMATVSCRLIEMLAVSSALRGTFECGSLSGSHLNRGFEYFLPHFISIQEVRVICLVFQVYYLGEGEESKQWLQQQDNTPEKLCLSHIEAVATYLASSYPMVTPIVWDDMLRGMSEETLAGV